MSRPRALFVAEKPSIAKTLAEVLSNGHSRHRGSQFSRYNPLYDFDLDVQSAVHPSLPNAGRFVFLSLRYVCMPNGHAKILNKTS